MILRPYQKSAVESAMLSANGIIVAPTGSGKSLVIAGIVNRSDAKTLVLQPTKEILEQNFEKIKASGFESATIFSASIGIKEIGQCTYATIGSIINCLDRFADVKTLIIDECHLVNSKGGQYEKLIKALKPERLVGLTATPYRLHTTSFGSDVRILSRTRPKLFDKIICAVQTPDLVKQGYLIKPEYIVSGGESKNLLKPNSTGAEYTEQSVENYLQVTDATGRVVDAAKDAIERGVKHILVFVPFVKDSIAIVEQLNKLGIRAASVSGESSKLDRESKLAKFKSGEITCVSNAKVLTIGFDFPALDCIISAKPTRSLALYYQIIGRGVRPDAQKKRVLVYDLVDNFAEFDDPLNCHIVESAPGLHAVLSPNGRLTNRIIGTGHEKNDLVEFGKYKGAALCKVPVSYLYWYLENAEKSNTWHAFKFELLRRQIFNNSVIGLEEISQKKT